MKLYFLRNNLHIQKRVTLPLLTFSVNQVGTPSRLIGILQSIESEYLKHLSPTAIRDFHAQRFFELRIPPRDKVYGK